jgi:L-alanine-DL-glutamate epimerase-like enolase superfamily enzyme
MNRRHFLEASAAAATLAAAGCGQSAASPEPRLESVGPSAEALDAAAAKPILNVDDIKSPVIIDSIRVLRKGDEDFIHIRSKDGAEGLALTNGREYVYPILKELIIPFLIGKDARLWESELMFELYRYKSNYKLQGLSFWTPHSWVEFALLDMLGRVASKSIPQLLGGPLREEAKFYVASGRRDTTPEQEVEYLQSLLDETGAHAVKFRLGGRMSRNADALPGRTPGLIKLARKTLGDKIDIHGDANSSYDPPQAIEVGRMMEEVNAVFYEEPCPFDHLFDTKVVADALTIPVALGEQEFSERRFRWVIEKHMADIVQPDLQYYGGLIRSLRVSRMADVAGMPTTPHISGGFGFVYMLHFCACAKDIGRYQEYKTGIEKYRDWFETPLEIRDGALTIPTGPGVGIKDIGAVIRGAKEVA